MSPCFLLKHADQTILAKYTHFSEEDAVCIVEAVLWLETPQYLEKAARNTRNGLSSEVFRMLGSAMPYRDTKRWMPG